MSGYSNPDALITGDILTLARWNQLRDSIMATAHGVFPLGGSDVIAIPFGGSYQNAPNYVEFYVPTTAEGGFTYRVECEAWTQNAATTVTPRLYNTTDAATTWTGSASTATARGTFQTSTALTIASGKRYRLQAQKSDDVYESWVIGRIVRTYA